MDKCFHGEVHNPFEITLSMGLGNNVMGFKQLGPFWYIFPARSILNSVGDSTIIYIELIWGES